MEQQQKYPVHRGLYEVAKTLPDPFYKMLANWLGGVFEAADQGKPILFNQFTIFSELTTALDIQPLSPELWQVMCLQLNPMACCESIDAAQDAGIHPELCSANKAIIGDLMLEKIPPPGMVVLPTFPCDNSKITYQTVGAITGAPVYFLDCPYWMDEGEAMDYWVQQYKGLISFMEEHSGKKLDWDRMKEVAEESNRAMDYWIEGSELLRRKPLPVNGPAVAGYMAGLTCLGTPDATAAVKSVRDDIVAKIEAGETAVPDEKARVVWFYYPVFWDGGLSAWMAEQGVVIPVGLVGYFNSGPIDTTSQESIIRGLARRGLETPMGRQGRGVSDLWIEDCLNAVEQWKADAVILAGHPGCKWLRGCYGLFRDIARERGIPVMIYDVDLFDPRLTSAEQSRAIIGEYLESVVLNR